MTVRLPKDLERFIRAKVENGQFASEDAAITAAVRLLRQRDKTRASEQERVEALIIAGLDSGPSTLMTDDDWDDIEREGKKLIAARMARKGR